MANDSFKTKTDLLSRVANGDVLAFTLIYEQFSHRIYTVSLKILKSTPLAEEVTQEVFLKFWRHELQFNDFDHLEAWLRTVARNLALNEFRKVVLQRHQTEQAGRHFLENDNGTEEAILLRDARALLDVAVEMLPSQQREVFILCHQEGLKYEEVAEKLAISVNTVKTHMKRALVSVRSYLKGRIDIVIIIILLKLF